ncbi:MAG: hypothetical protein HY929_01165, partial [Euryarchaeota archaeon]|nr:hypothetical protein [Euryarchaeota archaeon]
AWLILVTILTYTLSKREMSLELKNLMFELGKVFGFLVALGLLFTSWKVITAIMNPAKFAYVSLLLTESFSLSFWGIEILLGAIVPFLIVFIPRTGKTFSGLSVAALLCLMGIFMVRYDWTVAGQVIPVRGLPSLLYIPSYIEALIVVGIVTLCVLLYTWGVRNLPLEHKAVIPT